MKKGLVIVSLLALIVLSFSSCCTTRVTSVTKTKDPETGKVFADLNIQTEKITYVYRITIKTDVFFKEESLKDNAVYEALKSVGADVLVAPQFMVDRRQCPSETTYEITVSGYPASYTNFRQAAQSEKIEMRELKEGASYVIIRKSADNKEVGVDERIITAPAKSVKGINLDETTLDHIVLTNKKDGNKREK